MMDLFMIAGLIALGYVLGRWRARAVYRASQGAGC